MCYKWIPYGSDVLEWFMIFQGVLSSIIRKDSPVIGQAVLINKMVHELDITKHPSSLFSLVHFFVTVTPNPFQQYTFISSLALLLPGQPALYEEGPAPPSGWLGTQKCLMTSIHALCTNKLPIARYAICYDLRNSFCF